MITLEQLERVWDYLYWLFEYILLLLVWRKLKKQTIIIPQGKYNPIKSLRRVNLGSIQIRVPIYDIKGVYLIYPFKFKFDRTLKVIFFGYSSLNK